MRTNEAVTIRRLDYTPPAFLVDHVELDFTLDPDDTRVMATMRLRRNPDAPAHAPLELDGDGLTLDGLWVDGEPLSPSRWAIEDNARLLVRDLPDRCELRVANRIAPAANTALSGLYVSSGNFFTQCEAQGFRRITWFPDRPDVMARYKVTMRAPRDRWPVLLSNGNLLAERKVPAPDGSTAAGDEQAGSTPRTAANANANWHEAVWEDPFPKPSYLFALVAGKLVATEKRLRTASGREVLLQVWVEPGNEDRTPHAMESLVRAIRWDEQRFGLELDLDRFMIVAVGDFNMGAMENKGLNIFNTKYVFAHPRLATDADFAGVESVIGHEYFHNWTGNRVTCRDWFQLTLKEGLTVFRDQDFSADVLAEQADSPAEAASSRAVKRIEDVRVLRSAQFPEDAGPMAHPIRPDAYQEINNFYTVTVYEKGAEVIRMLQTLVGRDGFRRGMDLYFQRHDGQAVTCDDFVSAVADANDTSLDQFRRWYEQAGTPRVQVTTSYDAASQQATLLLRQFNPPTAEQSDKPPLHIPVALGLVGPDGRDLPLQPAADTARSVRRIDRETNQCTAVLDLVEAEQRFVFEGVSAAPVASVARGFSAPIIVQQELDDAALAMLAAHDSDPFNRWEAAQRLATRCVLAVIEGADPQQGCAAELVAALAGVLDDETLDPAFREQMFILPTEGYIAEQLAVVDPAALRTAREAVRQQLARGLGDRWPKLYARLNDGAPWSLSAQAVAARALKNVALTYWVEQGQADAVKAASAQFEGSDNMSDRAAALGALMLAGGEARERALARFEQEFASEPLAMDKWFMWQATMPRLAGDVPVLDRVEALMRHPLFTLRNPNRARSLVGSFCHGNLAEFHVADGRGHAFWAKQVLAMDPVNPQMAARLARALDRWRKFTPVLQQSMRTALQQVSAHDGLSRDVREIVNKALAEPEHADTNSPQRASAQ